MLVAECAPHRKNVRKAVELDGRRAVCAVNAFLSEEMKPYDRAEGKDYRARERYSVVMENCFRRMDGNLIEEAQKLLRGEYGFLCQYDEEPDFETVWSLVADLKKRMIYRAEGDPRKERFIEDERLRLAFP